MKKNLQIIALSVLLFFSGTIRSQNSLDFDGTDDRIDCGNDTSVQISGKALTLEAWIYPTAWKTNVYDGNVINKENNTNNYGFMLRVGAGGKLNFAFGNGSWHELTSLNTVLSLNTWQHIAGTYDGAKMRIYVNGVATDSSVVTVSIANTSVTNLALGYNATYGRYYQGKIDEVRIWNVCRTQNELNNNKGLEFCSTVNGLRAYYKFNQGKAGANNPNFKSLNDLSGFNNTGTLTGFTLNGSGSNWVSGQKFSKTIATSSDTVVKCDRYTSPSGKYIWTTSGVYNDTFSIGAFGCDSIITINLTIKKSSTRTISVFSCGSYKSPSGVYTWTKSGTYKDYLKNYLQCDSTLVINLKIGGSKDSINPKVCTVYKGPAGNTYTATGLYYDTLLDYKGCDSVIAINLTVYGSSYSTISKMACRAYVSPSNKYTWTATGIYKDTIENYISCDSIITVNLAIKSSSSAIDRSACKQFKSPSGKYTWTVSGTYKDTIQNTLGCDSVITVSLKISNPSANTISVTSCRSYIGPGKKRLWKKSGTYKDTLVNYNGCDSILTVNLKIINVNTWVTKAGSTLTAVNATGTYQWLNCDATMSPIANATNRSYNAIKNGDYAVEITDSGCVDTSVCLNISGISVNRIGKEISFEILPNPNNGNFDIRLPFECGNTIIRIRDISGKLVSEQYFGRITECHMQLELENASGLYLIEIDSPDFKSVRTLSFGNQ